MHVQPAINAINGVRVIDLTIVN